MNEKVVNAGDPERKPDKKIKRHAQESWIYPVASVALNMFGFPIAFLNIFTFFLGIYCLIKSYINIKNGHREGIVGHVIAGTILNIIYVSLNIVILYAVYIGASA